MFKSEILSHGWTALEAKLAAELRVDKATLPSLIIFPVVQSNIATSPSVLLAGQTTSQLPPQPLSSSHSYQLFVFFSTCPVVQAFHGANHVGTLPQSLITFQVAQSKTAKCQSVELSGHLTSQSHHTQSAQSCTSKLKGSHSSKFIVTVVVFQTFVFVTLVIQFPSAHGFP